MSTDPKATPTPAAATTPTVAQNATYKSMKIFTYPKIIFIWPTMIVAILCAIGMAVMGDKTSDPKREHYAQIEAQKNVVKAEGKDPVVIDTDPPRRFISPNNVLGVLFITVLFVNILIMAIDFPRFTIVALILFAVALTFFLLWLSSKLNVIKPLVIALESIFAVANSGFYLLIGIAIFLNLTIIWFGRYLDYWEILPNEILHNHGPFSDLERFPTTNLKFDKEIPDILEYMLLRSGRLVLHIQNERKAIVLDNVLWIDHKEAHLKKLMSRMEVRVTTDQEAANEAP